MDSDSFCGFVAPILRGLTARRNWIGFRSAGEGGVLMFDGF
jgi:hypothetical protein